MNACLVVTCIYDWPTKNSLELKTERRRQRGFVSTSFIPFSLARPLKTNKKLLPQHRRNENIHRNVVTTNVCKLLTVFPYDGIGYY